MKKSMFSFVIGASLLMACPFIVHGEDENPEEKAEENRSGLLSGAVEILSDTVENVGGQAGKSTGAILEETTKSVGGTVKDAVDFTAGTVKKSADPMENKIITSTVKDTGSLVEKAVENTTPAVKTAVKETTDTVTKTTSEVFEAADKTVENLPAVPVVTPVVKEVNKTVQKVTSDVQQTIEKTTDAVNETVEAVTDTTEKTVGKTVDVAEEVADLPYGAEKPAPAEPERPVSEQPATEDATRPAAPVTQPQSSPATEAPVQEDFPLENEDPVKSENPVVGQPPVENVIAVKGETDTGETTLQKEPPALNEETIEVSATQPIAEKNIEQPAAAEMMTFEAPVASDFQLPVAENEKYRSEAEKETATASKTPTFPEKQDGKRAIATVPAQPSSPSSAQASGSFAGHASDLGYGTIAFSEMFMASTGKLWYHKNSYAIIQWIHTPLRKPPETTPFLYVA